MSRIQLSSGKWVKITGIKSAIGDYNNWIDRDWRHSADIMIDLSDGQIWTDIFTDRNSWKEYHSNSIISLSRRIQRITEEKLTMELLKKYAIELMIGGITN